MKLKNRRFGPADARLSELGLSTSNFSRYASQEESFAILDAFREAGGNLIQTSGMCPGANLGDGFLGLPEELLGRWIRQRRLNRQSLVIATRIALARPVIGGSASYIELIRRSAEDSIRRIGCGFLDFLVVEWTDAIAPVAESIAAFEAVIESGEIRHIVPANFAPARVQEGLAAGRFPARTIAGLQVDYSLAARAAFEGAAARLSADYGLGMIARSPLAGGYLASRRLASGFGALRHRGPDDRHAAAAAEGVWPALSGIARASRHSPARIALAWVLSHPQVTSVLISVRTVEQLQELLAATQVHLTPDDLARLGGRAGASRSAQPSLP